MTSYVKITASIAFVSAAVLGLAACSSGSSSSSAPSSAAASAAASTAASSGASTVPVNIAPEVIAAYFSAVCLAPAADMGVNGALSADGKTCTAPDGKDIMIDEITSNLGDSRARYSLMVNYYTVAGATDVADCMTIAEVKKAGLEGEPAALSDTCVTNLMNAVADSLTKN